VEESFYELVREIRKELQGEQTKGGRKGGKGGKKIFGKLSVGKDCIVL